MLAACGVLVLAAHGGHEAPPPPPAYGEDCTLYQPDQCMFLSVSASGNECSPPGCAGDVCTNWRPCPPSGPPGSGATGADDGSDLALALGLGFGIGIPLTLLLLLLLEWSRRRERARDAVASDARWALGPYDYGGRVVVAPP